MKHRLTTEKLKNKFGDIKLVVLSQKGLLRISGIIDQSSERKLTYHTVKFFDKGIRAFGAKNHQKIIDGSSLGETIKSLAVEHKRVNSKYQFLEMSEAIKKYFYTEKKKAIGRRVQYFIKESLYADFTEYYNPEIFKNFYDAKK